jgi:XRE family transcriptional regulator, regulator of sulfur utilization
MSWNKNLNINQLDETLVRFSVLGGMPVPSQGWIHTVRTALGMSARTLGNRIGLSQPRITLMEKGEVDGSISLKTLEKAAAGLGCRVVYAFIPEEGSLQNMRAKQAIKKAAQLNQYAERHMELEDQANTDSFKAQSINTVMVNEYLKKWPRNFWDDL